MCARICLSLFTIFHLSYAVCGQSNDKIYTLQECVEVAIKNNPDVISAKFQMETSDINLQMARGSKLPFVSGFINHNEYNGRSINTYTNTYTNQQYLSASYGVNAGVTLWNGSSIQNFLRKSALDAKASEMDVKQAMDKLTLNIVLYYLFVLSNQEQLNIAQKEIENTSKKYSLLQIKNKEGAISPSDFYDMQGQLATDKLSVTATKNALETAKLTLLQAMDIPYFSNFNLEAIYDSKILEPYSATIEEVYNYTLQNMAMVKSAEIRKQSSSKAIEVAHGKLLPTLTLSGGLYTNYSSTATTLHFQNTTFVATSAYILMNNVQTSVYAPESNYQSEKIGYGSQWVNNFSSSIGLNLSIPLLSGLQSKSNLKLARINDREADFQKKTIKTQLRQIIEQDFVNMFTAYETYKTLSEQVQAYTQSFKAAEARFSVGAISTTDYLIVKNNIDRAKINLAVSRYDYIYKTKILDFYLGRSLW